MSYQGDPLDRSRNFRVYDGVNSEPRVIIIHQHAAPMGDEKRKGFRTPEFKKIFVAVLLLIGVYSMSLSDSVLTGRMKKNHTFVSAGEDTWDRVEPGFFAKMFCRGNQRARFCH